MYVVCRSYKELMFTTYGPPGRVDTTPLPVHFLGLSSILDKCKKITVKMPVTAFCGCARWPVLGNPNMDLF